jgi:hypothetical protein
VKLGDGSKRRGQVGSTLQFRHELITQLLAIPHFQLVFLILLLFCQS